MSSVPYTFANQTANIPLSQLDTNFANVKLSVDYVIQNAQANITSVGTLTSLSISGNLLVGNTISATGNISTNGNLNVAGNISATGNISAAGNTSHGNVLVSGLISAAGNVTGGNLITTGSISATGIITSASNVVSNIVIANTVTAPTLNAANVLISGNLTVSGNATVNGTTTFINTTNLNITDKNITIANGVSTSTLIDGAGIDAGSPTVAYIRYSHANQGWTTANGFSIGTTLSVTGNATLSGNTALSGVSTAPTPANTVANTQIATTAFVRNIIPTGVITLWYGSLASIPNGWFLCDGGNGTPDLRDRFIVGAGSTYAVAATGGSANAIVVSHTHTGTTANAGAHVHTYQAVNNFLGAQTLQNGGTPIGGQDNTGSAGEHQHTFTTDSTGSSGVNANLPPYYALAYIMKA